MFLKYYNSGTITSKSEFSILAEDSSYHEKCASGIIKQVENGTVKNTYNIGKINGSLNTDGDSSRDNYYSAGGIVGRIKGGIISNSYNSGVVAGGSKNGEICGYGSMNYASNCYYKRGNLNTGFANLSDTTGKVEALDTMPTVLSVINGDDVFTVNSSMNNGNPILKWQVK